MSRLLTCLNLVISKLQIADFKLSDCLENLYVEISMC